MTTGSLLPLPPAVRVRRVDVPGGPIALLERRNEGRPVVLVPGFTGSKEDFRLLLDPLGDAGHHVVAIDQRGQYESPGPDDRAAYAVPALAEHLLGLLDALSLRDVNLVGHSFGGLVSRAAVVARPELFRSLTLMGSGPSALTGPRVEILPLLAPVLEEGGMPALVDAVAALEADDPRALAQPPEIRAFLRARMLASAPAALLGMADALTSEPDRVSELLGTGVPVLVLHGEHDDAWSPEIQAKMAARLNARYVVVPGALHSPAVENAEHTASALLAFFADA